MPKRTIILEVNTSANVTVSALRRRTYQILSAFGAEAISYKKETLPDPDTIREGFIDWNTLRVKQRGKR